MSRPSLHNTPEGGQTVFDEIREKINRKDSKGLTFWDLILLDLRLEEQEDNLKNYKMKIYLFILHTLYLPFKSVVNKTP